MIELPAIELGNLLRPLFLARMLSGLAAALLCTYGARIALKVLRFYRVGRSSEGQLLLERRAELAATVVEVALGIGVLNLALSVVAADRLAPEIQGAMCAYGVFGAGEGGFSSLGATAALALGCALWIGLHRFDLRLRQPTLTRAKFLGLLLLVPLFWVDLALTFRFITDLDLAAVASCCSLSLGGESQSALVGASGEPTLHGALGLGAMLAAALGAALAWRKPARPLVWLAGLLSAAAAALGVLAVVLFVAPHVYETPQHRCPFCLLHAEAVGLGWPLFLAIFGGAAFGLSLLVVELFSGLGGEREAATAMERKLGRGAALCWSLALILSVAPVLRYWWLTDGASLFG